MRKRSFSRQGEKGLRIVAKSFSESLSRVDLTFVQVQGYYCNKVNNSSYVIRRKVSKLIITGLFFVRVISEREQDLAPHHCPLRAYEGGVTYLKY
jgi:RNA binding exosome subunit